MVNLASVRKYILKHINCDLNGDAVGEVDQWEGAVCGVTTPQVQFVVWQTSLEDIRVL